MRNADRLKCNHERMSYAGDEEPGHTCKGGNGVSKVCEEVDIIEPAPSFAGEESGVAGEGCRRGRRSVLSPVTG